MSRIGIGTNRSAGSERTQSAGEEAEASRVQPCRERECFLQGVQRCLEESAHQGKGAALVLVELAPQYVRRSQERIPALLASWSRGRIESIRFARIDERRYAFLIAPVAVAARARQLGESLVHALDPRVCPLLRRALPYAAWGMAVSHSRPVDARALLERAEQDAEQRRHSAARRRRLLPARRRQAPAPVLRPVPIAAGDVESRRGVQG